MLVDYLKALPPHTPLLDQSLGLIYCGPSCFAELPHLGFLLHPEIWKYYQSSSNALAKALPNVVLCWLTLAALAERPFEMGYMES